MVTTLLFLVIGFIVSGFTVLPAFICLAFGIPFTRKLNSFGLLIKENKIIIRYMLSMILLIGIYTVILFVILSTSSDESLKAFLIGSGISLVLSLGKIGYNPNNLSDYIQTQNRYFTDEFKDLIAQGKIGMIAAQNTTPN